jgi:hypothetical protein
MSSTGSAVATITSGATTSKPNIVINSVGKFHIQADVSSSTHYKKTTLKSSPIDVDAAVANIEFSPLIVSLSPYIYKHEYRYQYTEPAAKVTNVNEDDDITYSIVTADSIASSTLTLIKPSTVATIDKTGCFLTTNSCGSTGTSTFRICARVDATADRDYSSNIVLSDILTIKKATPTILQYPQIIITPPLTSSTLVYGQQYTINTQPITVTGIAIQYNVVGYGASSSSLSYGSYCINVPNSKCYAEYRLRFSNGISNGIVSNLSIQSNSPQGFTNPDILFALTNVPFQGVTAILQGKSLYPNSDNLWYDVNVPTQFITQDTTSIKFNGSYGTGNFNSTASPFQNSINTLSSNTDSDPSATITYSSTDDNVATITGTTVQITGVDSHFQINTAVSSTTNYNEITPLMSPQKYYTIKATPTITYFPAIPQTLVYGGVTFTIPSTISTTNTDTPGPLISYSTSDPTIAKISGNTIIVTGVGQYKINVTINATKNFNAQTYTYPTDPSTYYNTEWSIPKITFDDSTFVTSVEYGSTYNFTGVTLSNNDPSSQVLTYSIINSNPVVPSNPSVATLTYIPGVPKPAVTINCVGTFQIQASCPKSSNGFYAPQVAPSPTITVTNEIPIIEFLINNLTNSNITKSPVASWKSISVSSNGHYQSAVVSGGSIYNSSDYGSTWLANNNAPTNVNWYCISLSSTGKYQSAVIYGGQVYISSNYGATWDPKAPGAIWDPAAPGANWNSISISSTGQTQVATINGGYIYYSGDYGATWNTVAITHTGTWHNVSISSTGQYQTAVEYGGSIYTSINTGQSWNEAPNTRSKNWNSVSISSTGKYQAAVEYGGTIYTSSDYGSTWNPVTSTSGAPVSSWVSISISSTGQYQVAGTSNGTIYTSPNYGATWHPVTNIPSGNMPQGNWSGISLSSTGQYQTACLLFGNIYFSSNYGATWDTDASVSYIYRTTPYNFTPSNPIAHITNNIEQKLKYYIVFTDGISRYSGVATITEDGTSLTTTGVGSFQILATTTATDDGNYGAASLASEIITVLPGTTNITTYPEIARKEYGGPFFGFGCPAYISIANMTTDNNDIDSAGNGYQGPRITFSSSNNNDATVSGDYIRYNNVAYGRLDITAISMNNFQIIATIQATTNYKSGRIILPSPTTYCSVYRAYPLITFPPNFGSGWKIGMTQDLTSSVTVNETGLIIPAPANISYSIVDQSVSDIATISGSGSQIKINSAGTFRIQAYMPQTDFYSSTYRYTDTITINTSTVSLTSNNFSGFVYNGGPYAISVSTTNTDTPGPNITYSIDSNYGTIWGSNGNLLTPKAAGSPYMYVNISATQNFDANSIPVSITIAPATPNVNVNHDWVSGVFANYNQGNNPVTIGELTNSPLIQSNSNPKPRYAYSSSDNSVATIVWTGSDYQIKPQNPGSFYITIDCVSQSGFNIYADVRVSTRTIYISAVPEVIIFSNQRAWPWAVGVPEETGMIIGFPSGAYPIGFSNYSVVQIVNAETSPYGNSSVQIDYNTTPNTFQTLCTNSKYAVIFAPQEFYNTDKNNAWRRTAWNPKSDFPDNLGYVTVNSLASGVLTGKPLMFYFTGKTYGDGPSSLALSWYPKPGTVEQGHIRGYHPSIGTSKQPFSSSVPNGVSVSEGYYDAWWSGYGLTNSQQFMNVYGPLGYGWGGSVWHWEQGNPNRLEAPTSGSSLMQAWGVNGYSVTASTEYDGNRAIYFYRGIPKLLYPNYYNGIASIYSIYTESPYYGTYYGM